MKQETEKEGECKREQERENKIERWTEQDRESKSKTRKVWMEEGRD